jgi:hypothetical protein
MRTEHEIEDEIERLRATADWWWRRCEDRQVNQGWTGDYEAHVAEDAEQKIRLLERELLEVKLEALR